ncbi:MAG: acetyltransferase [Ferruginibacter sp.]|nr:acetyltransferase [Ferruginibacter sp.]
MNKDKKLIIYGIGETAEIIADYFIQDSKYEVVAFTADEEYKKTDLLLGLPVIPFNEAVQKYPPAEYEMFAAASFGKINRIRTRMYQKGKALGYKFASYVNSNAFVWHNAVIGENTFIFEENVIQYKVKIGNNVILWSGNHIGHQTIIEENCFISSHVVISGFCTIGKNSFLGVNTSFNDGINFGKDSITGNGTIVVRDTEPGSIYVGSPAKKIKSSYEAFDVKPDQQE